MWYYISLLSLIHEQSIGSMWLDIAVNFVSDHELDANAPWFQTLLIQELPICRYIK